MLWLNNKISNIVDNVNPKDIAFLLASSLEINKAKKSNLKAQTALQCIFSHKLFSNYLFEFYLKDPSKKLRCAAIEGVDSKLKLLYIGRSVPQSGLEYSIFSNKKIGFF